ncbi:MAG: DUF4367 domain-containing protein [Acidobacteriota bacterium]
MKLKTHCPVILLVISIFLTAGFSQSAAAQSKDPKAFAQGILAALSDKQVGELLALRIPVAIPTYIPAGFRVDEVQIEKDQYTTGYTIRYANNRGATFAIQSADDGIGSVETVKTLKGKNPYFNNGLEVGYQVEDKTEIWGEWIENRRQASGSKKLQYYSLTASKISLQEAMKIMKSLRYLQR